MSRKDISASRSRYRSSPASGAQAADMRFLSSWDKTNPAVAAMAETFAKGVEAGNQGQHQIHHQRA